MLTLFNRTIGPLFDLIRRTPRQPLPPVLPLGYPMAAPVRDRPFSIQLPPEALTSIQAGTLKYKYRGRECLKDPFDLALYLRLLGCLLPQTIIEIGTFQGGFALWCADMMAAHGIRGRVLTIDNFTSPEFNDNRITFLRGDILDLGRVLTPALLGSLPHPWLVVEDAGHRFETSIAALEFFDSYLLSGDYYVTEDGILRCLPGEQYREYLDGPSRALEAFLAKHGQAYEIDTDYCDFFGYNVTWNPNGWLKRL